MDWESFTGIGLFIVGIIAYGTGIYIPYPGRAFSIAAIMVGIAIVLITGQMNPRQEA